MIFGSAIDGALITPRYRFNRTSGQSPLAGGRPAGLELWFIRVSGIVSSGQLVAYSELSLHVAPVLAISGEATTINCLVGWLKNGQMLSNISPGQSSLRLLKSFSSEEPCAWDASRALSLAFFLRMEELWKSVWILMQYLPADSYENVLLLFPE